MHRELVKKKNRKKKPFQEATENDKISNTLFAATARSSAGSTFLSSLFPISFTRASSHKYTREAKERNLNIIETKQRSTKNSPQVFQFSHKEIEYFFYVELSVRCFFSFKSNIRNAWRKYIVDSGWNDYRAASSFQFFASSTIVSRET